MKPLNIEAYNLFHEGIQALSDVERNGFCIDTEYLNKIDVDIDIKIAENKKLLKEHKVYKTWRKAFGQKTNIASYDQLGKVLFNILKFPCNNRTKTGKFQADEKSLLEVDSDFVPLFLSIQKLSKAKNTYIKGLVRETCDGFLHPMFSLHTASSFRSSSEKLNFQNIPIRNIEVGELIRKAFISRWDDGQLVEVDFKGIEVSAAACYHKDPKMIDYIKDTSKDMHRDMAMQIYMLNKNQITKDIRYCGKNLFVFPQFYGDWYLNCAKNLWNAIQRMKLKLADGTSLKKHLKQNNITELGACNPDKFPREGTFEHHLKQVEHDFWHKRFKDYYDWKIKWWNKYLEKGYFDLLTGFRVSGIYDRKQVINIPIQGAAFHWLLWCLIRINKKLQKHKMKSLIVGQIHDSIISDVCKGELKDYLEIANEAVQNLPKHWDWINVPLVIETEVSPIGKTWYDKQPYKI